MGEPEVAGAAASRREESAAERAAVILTPDQRVRVFISSTLEELAAERAAARRAIARLNLVSVWYESGARPHPPRSLYRAYLQQSQVFVGIYWQRYGWVAPGMQVSGLEDEYRLAAGRPMLLYLKLPAPEQEPRLTAMIEDIRAAGTVSYRTFATPRELERLLAEDLAVVLSERFAGAAVDAGAELPAGTVTFLLTDIEGSTRLWETVPEAMEVALEQHNRLLTEVIGGHGGIVVKSRGEGDSFFAVFASAVAAVEAAGGCQLGLNAEAWPEGAALPVRMGLHTGEVRVRGGDHLDYAPINRCARVKAAAHGGQVLLTQTTRDLVAGRLGGGFGLKRLGEFRLRDLAGPELIYQLTHADLPAGFPPIRTLAERGPRPLPAGTTSLVGREQAVDELAGLLARPGVRLVTLTGPGGVGKTRLALAVGERAGGRFGSGAVFVPLAGVTAPELVVGGIGRAVGADLVGTGAPLQALAEQLGDGAWLLILDNLEQVIDAARDLDELLARCPGVVIMATSRTVLGLRAEREYPVPPLPLPAGPATMAPQELTASPAVALFVDRARAVWPDFALTEGNAAAVVAICRRLDGLPLAIELAAARTRLLDPGALLDRLTKSLDALGTGTADLPERQRTLRATVEWSVGLLDDAERSLLETMAVFAGSWTVEAAGEVAGLAQDRALELTEALARHSLVQPDRTERGPRLRMLETIRAFVAERLADRPDAAEVARRHADYYRALAARADRPPWAGQREWSERLQAEAGNLAAAVRWHLAHDPGPLPHLFRVLWLFWELRGRLGRGPRLGRTAPAHRRHPRPPGPRRAAVDCGGHSRRDGRRPRGACGPPAPGAAAGPGRRPVPARLVPTGPGVDLDHRRGLGRDPAGGVSEHGRVPRPGRADVDRLGRPQRRLGGDGHWPLRRRLGSSDGGARPGGAVRQLVDRRHVTGGPGHSSVGAGPSGGGPGAAGRRAGPEPGGPQHPERDDVSGRVGPVGTGGGRRRAGSAGGGGGRGTAPAGRAAGVADTAAGRSRPGGPGPAGARRRPFRPGIRHRHPAQPAGRGGRCQGRHGGQHLADGVTGRPHRR